MTQFILDLLGEMILGVNNPGNGILIQTPQEYNSGLYNIIMQISNNAVLPVAYVILGCLFMLELHQITIRTEGMNSNGFEIPFKAMFKIVVCKYFVDSTPLLMGAIYNISTRIIGNIGGVVSSEVVTPDMDQITQLAKFITELDFATRLMYAALTLIIWIIYKFTMIAVSLIILGRMFEIYIHLAIAPLPMATLPNKDLSSIAKNFMKSFAAVSVQGVLIFLVLIIYGVLVGGMVSDFDPSHFTSVLMQMTLYAVALAYSIFMTGKWSKSICNAM